MGHEDVLLPASAPGTRRFIRVRRYGDPGARPKAYIQAGLHGDELPGILVAGRLQVRLAAAVAEGRVLGEILLVPVANPIGLGQVVMDAHLGRFDLANQTNFNRGWPELTDSIAAAVGSQLGPDATANASVIRVALRRAAADLPAESENQALRRTLFALACDADLVLDLHCDLEAVPHLYVGTPHWPAASDLAAAIGAEAVLLAERSGGSPFDEACSALWWELQRRFPQHPIPLACLAATVEHRGQRDVAEALADRDAVGLLHFLQGRGLLRDVVPPHDPPHHAEATPLAGLAMVRAPAAGIVDLRCRPGQEVAQGDLLALVVDPLADPAGPAPAPIRSPVAGRVIAHMLRRFTRPGDIIVKVAGAVPFGPERSMLLSD